MQANNYEALVKKPSEVMWEIDPPCSKIKSLGKVFPSAIENNFLGFNKPASHGHKTNSISSYSLALKIDNFAKYIDRSYMISRRM